LDVEGRAKRNGGARELGGHALEAVSVWVRTKAERYPGTLSALAGGADNTPIALLFFDERELHHPGRQVLVRTATASLAVSLGFLRALAPPVGRLASVGQLRGFVVYGERVP
jgi:hypothetical protein